MVATIQNILRYTRWLEDLSPGFLAETILMETGEDFSGRDLLDEVGKLIELFGVTRAAQIVGCACPTGRVSGC